MADEPISTHVDMNGFSIDFQQGISGVMLCGGNTTECVGKWLCLLRVRGRDKMLANRFCMCAMYIDMRAYRL